jgi:hypothetical protein
VAVYFSPAAETFLISCLPSNVVVEGVNLGNLRLIFLRLSRRSLGEGGCFLCFFVTKYISEIREICG